jgi:hypothetical protein
MAAWLVLLISTLKNETHTSETLTDFKISNCSMKDGGSAGMPSNNFFVVEKRTAPLYSNSNASQSLSHSPLVSVEKDFRSSNFGS